MKNSIREITDSVRAMMELRYAARAQCDHDLEFRVILPSPTTDCELHQRWSEPQDWCAQNIPDTGGLWSRRRNRQNGELVYTFDDSANAELFASRFEQ